MFKFVFSIQIINKLKKDAHVPGNFSKYPIPKSVEKKSELTFI